MALRNCVLLFTGSVACGTALQRRYAFAIHGGKPWPRDRALVMSDLLSFERCRRVAGGLEAADLHTKNNEIGGCGSGHSRAAFLYFSKSVAGLCGCRCICLCSDVWSGRPAPGCAIP